MSEDKKQQPMSIEQAGNYIAEKKETLAEDIKKEAKAAPISFASPEDRQNFLLYGLSLMEDVSESVKNAWCALTHKAPALYTTKEICGMLRKVLVLRINGCSREQIAHHVHSDVVTIGKVENLAVEAAGRAIETRKNSGIPIIGGMN